MRTASSVALFTCKGSVPKSPCALGVVLAGLLVVGVAPADLRAATTTYTSAYSGGTIAPGDTVRLNNGATVTGNVIDNGTLQFNQSGTTLTITSTISGTGTLFLTNTGTLNLTGTTGFANTVVLDMTTSASSGLLQIRSGTGNLWVGGSGTGTLGFTGGRVTNSIGYLGYNAGSNGTATVQIGTWANSGDLIVGYNGTGTLNVYGGSVTSSRGFLGNNSGSVGTATISEGLWANSNRLDVGVNGIGTLNVTGGSVTNTSCDLGSNAGSVGTATVSSGTWANSNNLSVGNSGTLRMSGGLVTVGGILSKGTLGTINLNAGGTLQIGTGGTTGVLAADLSNNGTLIFSRSGASTHSGVISGTGTIQNAGTGTTTLTGQTSFTNGLVATAGRLIVGSTASINGFSTTGSLAAASGVTIELKSKGLAYVNGLSSLTSGTILAANGISLGAGANVVGTGAVSGAVSTVRGSRIEADGGKLVVGDLGSYVGFDSDGRLYTNANEVELLDRNLAVLGALTQLGDGSAGGTLRAANGMLLEQGKNLVGRGTVYGNFVNQGDVYGDGSTAGQEIIFAAGSTVSGNGSFTNALFRGTYSPGNSPAITSLQDGVFAQSSTLLIEVGGTQAGSQYDQVQDASTLSLGGGSLNVVLTNSFVPAPGNSFQILRYGQLSGDFGAVNLPAFDNGLGWQRLTTGTAMTLVAAPSAVNIDVAAGSKTLAAAGYSSLVYATSLNKSGAGALILNSPSTLTGPTTIQQGTVQLADSSALGGSTISPLAGGVLSLSPYLQATVGGLNPNAGGLVDVGTGMITVANGLTPTALVTALQSGRAGGSWTGSSGITSSAAASALASTTLRSVGWLDNGNGSVMFGYAATGDTNLDWVIDILDVANFVGSGKFNSGLTTTWAEGDFNYDGYADILDMADFMSTGLFDTGTYNAPAGTIAAVPEPSTLGLIGIGVGVAGLLAAMRVRNSA